MVSMRRARRTAKTEPYVMQPPLSTVLRRDALRLASSARCPHSSRGPCNRRQRRGRPGRLSGPWSLHIFPCSRPQSSVSSSGHSTAAAVALLASARRPVLSAIAGFGSYLGLRRVAIIRQYPGSRPRFHARRPGSDSVLALLGIARRSCGLSTRSGQECRARSCGVS